MACPPYRILVSHAGLVPICALQIWLCNCIHFLALACLCSILAHRVFIAAFDQSIGGAEAANAWVKTIDMISQHVQREPATPIFPGVFKPEIVQRWKEEAHVASIEKAIF